MPFCLACLPAQGKVERWQLGQGIKCEELTKTHFSCSLSDFFVDFRREITEKGLEWTKKHWKWLKKVFWPAFGCAQYPKTGRNTQHPLPYKRGLPQTTIRPIHSVTTLTQMILLLLKFIWIMDTSESELRFIIWAEIHQALSQFSLPVEFFIDKVTIKD